MNIYKNKLISRFGLMHMIATNICVWFSVLILETYHEIADHLGHLDSFGYSLYETFNPNCSFHVGEKEEIRNL